MATQAVPTITHASLRRALARGLWENGELGGAPVPLEGFTLVVEPSFAKRYPGLEAICKDPESEPAPEDSDWEFVNSWQHCRFPTLQVLLMRSKLTGKVEYGFAHRHRIDLLVQSIGACDVHDIETEMAATQALSELVTERQLSAYLLGGAFLESSKRGSGVTYIFRRARPTIALSARSKTGGMKPLCALCMHPIAFYSRTHIGAMTPTDDVIAHLLLMRADEPMFWRRCNQHAPDSPEAGI